MKIEIFNKAEITPETKEQTLIFKPITKEESSVYRILCPVHNKIEKDKLLEAQLPQRCFEIAEMIKENYDFFEIWEAESEETKDPLLFGCIEDKQYNWVNTRHLISRWGEELDTFTNLRKKAFDRLKQQTLRYFIEEQAKIEAFLKYPDIFIEEKIMQNRIEKTSI